MRGKLATCAALLVACGWIGTARAEVTLRWRFQKSDSLRVVMTQNSQVVTRIKKTPITMTVALTMEMLWNVKDVDAQGVASVEQRFQRLALSLRSTDQPAVDFDSAVRTVAPAARPIADSLQPLIDKPITVKMTPRGEITAVELSPEATKAVAKIAENSRLKKLLSRKGIADLLKQSVAVLPAEPLKSGQKWKASDRIDSRLGAMTLVSEFAYAGPQKKAQKPLEKIELTGTLTPQKKPAAKAPVSKLKSHSLKGVLWFDLQAGRLDSSRIEQQLISTRLFRGTPIETQTTTVLDTRVEPQ